MREVAQDHIPRDHGERVQKRWAIATGACTWAACLAPLAATAQEDVRQHALGEAFGGGYPSHQERVVLYLTNRARSAPAQFNPEQPFPPSPPLRYDLKLSQAARFHARHIEQADCWCEDHSSCCELVGQGEQTMCASAPQGCGGTNTAARVGKWSGEYSAENMARGQRSGIEAVGGWIDSPGHWQNINGSHSLLGAGNVGGAWVQDFGRGSELPAVLGDGIHFQDAGATTFGATYYQPGSGGPRDITLILEGVCQPLSLVAGTPEHGAFEATSQLAPGCHRYYFFVRDGLGEDHVYPTQGSLGVAVGAADGCPLYDTNRPADTCSPVGQACETGDTRPCYTGDFGTRGVGACEAGVERCIGAAWQGECRLQVVAAAQDLCADGVDNDCDGAVDEDCDGGDDAADMRPPVSMDQTRTPGSSEADEAGCSSAPARPPLRQPAWLLGMMAIGWLCTRRARLRRDERRISRR